MKNQRKLKVHERKNSKWDESIPEILLNKLRSVVDAGFLVSHLSAALLCLVVLIEELL